jgi:hypothetical protein
MQETLPNGSLWDEFHDPEVVNWKRCRSVIEHENNLVNHRLSWLFASQGFLYGAYGVLLNIWKNPSDASNDGQLPQLSYPALLVTIALVGMLACLAVHNSITEAQKNMDELERWWYNKGCKYESDDHRLKTRKARDTNHPPLQSFTPFHERHLIGLINYTHIPNVFCLAWLFLCYIALELPISFKQAWALSGILIIIIIIYLFQARLRIGEDLGKKISTKFRTRKPRILRPHESFINVQYLRNQGRKFPPPPQRVSKKV